MADEERPSRVVVTDAWRKEQQAKREAYEAKRRSWTGMLARGDEAEETDAPEPDGTSTAGVAEAGGAVIRERRGRRGGTIQDKRQTRFTF
jgi:hypothetical protein